MPDARPLSRASSGGYKAPRCACGHTSGDHKSSGNTWPHNPAPGICLMPGCACKGWVSAVSPEPYDALSDEYAESDQEYPRHDGMTAQLRRRSLLRHDIADHGSRPIPSSPDGPASAGPEGDHGKKAA